jgi:hypothetical protein
MNPAPDPHDSLLTGKITGNSFDFASSGKLEREFTVENQWFTTQFPKNRNRQFDRSLQRTQGAEQGFVEGADRGQITLFPDCLEDWIGEDNPVRVIDVFIDELDLADLGFDEGRPVASGSSARVCARFVALCRTAGLFTQARQLSLWKSAIVLGSGASRPVSQRGDRRQEVQGGEQPRQELHARQDGPAYGADRGERHALSGSSSTPAGAKTKTSRLKEKIAMLMSAKRSSARSSTCRLG